MSWRHALLVLAVCCAALNVRAQETPLLSGGAAFLSSTNGGRTSFLPLFEPLLAAPIGPRILIESRAGIVESLFPKGNGQSGYDHQHFLALTYLQGDLLVSPHLTLVGGSFLVPFGTYNERLSPVWINNLQDGPLISSLGLMSTGTGVGGMARGSVLSRHSLSIDYTAYVSAHSSHEQFNAQRSSGGRADVYFPQARLEIGASYGRLLQGIHEGFYGTHVWWEPKDTGLRLRSEFARGQHAQGYWIEADYRSAASADSWVGRFEPVFRMQQTFRRDILASDGLSLSDQKRPEFGLDYNLPHNTRIITSYARQLSAAGNSNIWETGIVYRLLFPAWKGRKQ